MVFGKKNVEMFVHMVSVNIVHKGLYKTMNSYSVAKNESRGKVLIILQKDNMTTLIAIIFSKFDLVVRYILLVKTCAFTGRA